MTSNETSTLFKTFAGNEVSIMLINHQPKKTMTAFVGTLLDECPDFFYLGSVEKGIFAAVKRSEIMGIVLADEAHHDVENMEMQ